MGLGKCHSKHSLIRPGKVEKIFSSTMLKKISSIIAISALVLLPVVALGQTYTVPEAGSTILGTDGFSGVESVLTKVANWMLTILILVAIIFFIYAGFLYLTSGGEEEKVKTAKGYVVYGLIAVAVGLLAKGFISLVQSLTSASG